MDLVPEKAFDVDRALRLLLEGTMAETGVAFFQALARNASDAFGVEGAWVTEYIPNHHRLRALAFWHRGRFIDNFEYDITDTPCERVVMDARLAHFPERIMEIFPNDADLKTLDAVSYLGVPLLDSSETVIGHLGAIDSRPLPADDRMVSLFEIFALRASAELQRLRNEQTVRALTEETQFLRDSVHELPGPDSLLGESAPMRKLTQEIRRVAPTDATALITGETGTGKELVARAVHSASRRADRPLVRVNCAAIPANLMESEFFGHERGAFTGALARREGRFSLADSGTIFLDEIGELSLDLQAKLLRVLQEGEFEMVGSSKTRKVDVRVVAATNRDLQALVRTGEFREDLFYRVCVFPLRVPPLRERGSDIMLLADTFAARFARRMGTRVLPLCESEHALLLAYDWPGNVRELQNVIERAIILRSGNKLNLTQAMPDGSIAPRVAFTGPVADGAHSILTDADLKELERRNIEHALKLSGGKISGANGVAARLGMPASTLRSRMKALGIRTETD